MASTVQTSIPAPAEIDYPTGDGQSMAETTVHRQNLTDLIWKLDRRFLNVRDFYVSGNMFVYYVEGNRNRHLAPDVFAVFGVPRKERECYKTWEEPKRTLDAVIEITSRTTKDEDLQDKFRIYRDELGVLEYMLFDPYEEYLDPPEQLYRLVNGVYQPVKAVDGRLPSRVLNLHFERSGKYLRLYDPAEGRWLPTPQELIQEKDSLLQEKDAEIARLRRAMESLRGGSDPVTER